MYEDQPRFQYKVVRYYLEFFRSEEPKLEETSKLSVIGFLSKIVFLKEWQQSLCFFSDFFHEAMWTSSFSLVHLSLGSYTQIQNRNLVQYCWLTHCNFSMWPNWIPLEKFCRAICCNISDRFEKETDPSTSAQTQLVMQWNTRRQGHLYVTPAKLFTAQYLVQNKLRMSDTKYRTKICQLKC